MANPIVTLTSDLGTKDFYVSTIKGALLGAVPGVQIIDVSHDVPHYDIGQAAYMVRNAYKHFPEGSIHIIAVRNEYDTNAPHLACLYFGHIFIGTDTGIFSLIFDKKPDIIVELPHVEGAQFVARDVFVPAIELLMQERKVEKMGKVRTSIKETGNVRPTVEHKMLRGTILHIDHYGNVITNIKPDLFERACKGRDFSILIRGGDEEITAISPTYGDVVPGDIAAVFGISGYLEVGQNQGNAAKFFGLRPTEPIIIEFRDN